MKRRGFNLIELLVVLLIIGVLIGVVYGVFVGSPTGKVSDTFTGTVVHKYSGLADDGFTRINRIEIKMDSDGSVAAYDSSAVHSSVVQDRRYQFSTLGNTVTGAKPVQ